MSIISWEKRPDGKINVWDSPVRWVGRKRVIENPDEFFESVRAISPFAVCGLVQGDYGFCADPGVFALSRSYAEKRLIDLEKNIVAMVGDWRPVHLNAAKDAMMEIAPESHEYNQNISTWIMKYIKQIVTLDNESSINAYDVIHDSETGYRSLTRKHHAAALRNLLEYAVSHALRVCDFLRVVNALHTGVAFKVELEVMVATLNTYTELRQRIDEHIQARAADRCGLRAEIGDMKRIKKELLTTNAYKLVNGRHPRLGRHGSAYAESIRGIGKEADRMLVLTRLVRERFADVIDVLGVDQVLDSAAMD